MSHRKEKVQELLRHLAAEFFKKESGPNSLITVTRVDFDQKKNQAAISVSIYPQGRQPEALAFVYRQNKNFAKYLRTNSKLGNIPLISFVADTYKIDG